MKKLIKIIIPVMCILSLVLVSCGKTESSSKTEYKSSVSENSDSNKSEDNNTTENSDLPIATIEIEKFGTIKAELYPKVAPNTVNNFISLVAQFGVDIDSQKVLGIVQTVCSILILLGVLNDPTQNAKGYLPGVCDKLIDNIKE